MKNIFVCFPWAFSYDYMDKDVYADNRDFKIQRCHDNENIKRAKCLKSKTKTLHLYHTFLYNSLPFFFHD